MGDLLLGTIQAAKLLGVSRYYLLEHKAEFDHVVLPGKRPSYRWYKASLEAWLAYRTHQAKIPLGQDDSGRALSQPSGVFGQKEAETALARWVAEYQASGRPSSLSPIPLDSGPITTVFEVLEKRLAWLRSHGNARHLKDTESLFRYEEKPQDYLRLVQDFLGRQERGEDAAKVRW